MPNESAAEPRRGGLGVTMKGLLALAGSGLFTWFGNTIWDRIEDNAKDIDISREELLKAINEVKGQVDLLKEDRSKWGALSELHERQQRLEIEVQVTQRIFEIEFNRRMGKGAPLVQPPVMGPGIPETLKEPPPAPRPSVQQRALEPEQFKELYERRFKK